MANKIALKTAFLILGIVIGAGFASGKEIATFFLDYSNFSSILLVLMAFLIFYIIYIFVRVGRFIKPKAVNDITTPIFKKYSKVIDAIVILSLFISTFAMLAGVDALATDVFVDYSFPYFSIILCFLIVLIVMGGLKSLLQVNSIIVPIIIVLVIGIAASFLIFGNLGVVDLGVEVSFINFGTGVFSVLLYVCMNMFTVGIIVAEIGAMINNKGAAKIAIYSMILITICVGIVLIAILNSSNLIATSDMPMIRIAYSMGEVTGAIYSLVILFGIFTTAIAASFAVNNWLIQFIKDKLIAISIIVTLAFIVSRLGFSNIVQFFYPIEGVFGLVFIVGVIAYYYKNRQKINELE
ncbi:MAG: hypothetical protein PHC46_04050 [Clostridia bacterium]|nr:hypothetical protein [Clostridia bacterium]